ncbi:MAG: hypothetical protein JWO46_1031 [Nocardioidaceae bacterium]|nr:hypothetical protein [Nocardioidaceae bacterium]
MSTTAKVNLTIAVWALLVVAPALIVQATVAPDTGSSALGGGVIGAWFGGYLLQFVFMYVVIAVAHTQKFWWWLGASLLPWVVDWTVPLNWVVGGIAIAATIAFAVAMAAELDLLADFRHDAKHVDATVVKICRTYMNMVINGVYIRRKLLLDIPADDGTTYQGYLHVLTEIGQIPSVGSTIPLLVDPKNPKRFKEDVGASQPS